MKLSAALRHGKRRRLGAPTDKSADEGGFLTGCREAKTKMRYQSLLAALTAVWLISGCDDSDDTAATVEKEPRLVRAVQIGGTDVLGQRSFTGRAS